MPAHIFIGAEAWSAAIPATNSVSPTGRIASRYTARSANARFFGVGHLKQLVRQLGQHFVRYIALGVRFVFHRLFGIVFHAVTGIHSTALPRRG